MRRWISPKRIISAVGLLFAIVLTFAIWLLVSEWTYIQRLRTYPGDRPITTVDWFRPKAIVAGGAEHSIRIASPEETGMDSMALETAARHAEVKNSSALLVLHKGRIVLERYWNGHNREAWSDSQSMAKTVTALLIGIAVAEGHIPSVNAPAAMYLKKWAIDARRQITLRHLMQMHSGLRPMGEYDDPFSDACYLAVGTDNRYVVDYCPALRAPDQQMDYNNVNFQVLGCVIEEATGRSFQDYLSEKLWEPLGNGDAAVWLDRPDGTARTFGFIFATARDWARVGLLIQNAGRVAGKQIVHPEWVRFMCTPSPTDANYGAGIYTGPDGDYGPFVATDTVALNGGHKQRVYVIPSRQLVIVRVGENAKDWDDARLPNLIASGVRNED